MSLKHALDIPSTGYIPILSTEAGSALIASDWASVGVQTVSYYLDALLMKPGLAVLNQLPSLASYVGGSMRLVLNGGTLLDGPDSTYQVISQYDGSKQRYSLETILDLVEALQPEVFILPRGAGPLACQRLSETIRLVISLDEFSGVADKDRYAGFFVREQDPDVLFNRIQSIDSNLKDKIVYVMGAVNASMHQRLLTAGVRWIESNRPAQDALAGQFYSSEGECSITDASMEMAFEPLDAVCACSTCRSDLTRAYLHHLYEQTPGLCQRFLALHNAFKIRSMMPA
jgi:queuine tRNA-ribosyltransferase